MQDTTKAIIKILYNTLCETYESIDFEAVRAEKNDDYADGFKVGTEFILYILEQITEQWTEFSF